MRHIIRITFAVFISFGLILATQYSTLSQSKPDEESTRAMVERLKREIQEIQAKIAEDPSSPEAEKLKGRMQWNLQKIKAVSPDAAKQVKPEVENPESSIPELEDYMIITKNNLFNPLGAGNVVKKQEFVLTGILGSTAIIQDAGGSQSYYVAEGKSFGNGAKLTRIGTDSVTVFHNGEKAELRLGVGTTSNTSRRNRNTERKPANQKKASS